MSRRAQLPQLSGRTFLTDGGLETTLIFENGIDLPHFASFPLLESEQGIEVLRDYSARYIEHAELDESEELDAGDPLDLAGRYRTVRKQLENLSVIGGCCGTNHRHVAAIAAALTS
ncbi:MAG: homocysteine S-methyltransferase family protein [Gaiellaceae bacterium]